MKNYSFEIGFADPSYGLTLGIQMAYGEGLKGQFRSLHFGFLFFDVIIYHWI